MSSSLIEETYFQAWGKAGGPGRARRAFSLSGSMWRMLEFQIKKDRSGITDDVKEMLRRDEDLDQTLLKQLAASLGVLDLLDELDAEMKAGWGPS